MKEYRVRFTGENGRSSYQEFHTIEQARELYESLNGEAVIQKFDQGTDYWEDIVYPIYEF